MLCVRFESCERDAEGVGVNSAAADPSATYCVSGFDRVKVDDEHDSSSVVCCTVCSACSALSLIPTHA